MHCHVTGGRQTDLGGKVKHHCGVWSFGIHDVHVPVMIGQSIDNRVHGWTFFHYIYPRLIGSGGPRRIRRKQVNRRVNERAIDESW